MLNSGLRGNLLTWTCLIQALRWQAMGVKPRVGLIFDSKAQDPHFLILQMFARCPQERRPWNLQSPCWRCEVMGA